MLHIYRASAGSGKTYRLTQDYIHLLFDPKRERAHRRILAVTFTNKATDEMKTRILEQLHALAQGLKSDYRAGLMQQFGMNEEGVNQRARKILVTILHDYSSFSISTIDRFFQQVIRSFARDIGVHGGYNLELDNSQTLEQAVDNMFIDLSKDEHKQLLHWLTTYAEERVEQSENWNMRGNILDLGQEIFKENYQHKAEDTNRKLHDREFLTSYRKNLRLIKDKFEDDLRKKASEGLAMIARQGLTPESFKGGSRSAMKTLEKLAKGEQKVSATFLALPNDVGNCYTKTTPKDIIASIESVYNGGLQTVLQRIVDMMTTDIVAYNSAVMVLKHINTLGILSDLAVQIKKLTDEQNTMLISDSNMLLNKIIDQSDTPFVYEKTGVHIDNYMIDEFQDTSVLQWKNFKPLMDNSLGAEKFNLVVGDVKQSIYRWRNSDWKLLDERILTDFRSEQLHEENLDTNWRSDKNVIDFNNSFFRRAAITLQQKLNAALEPVLGLYPELQALNARIEHAYDNLYQHVSPKAGEGHVRFQFIDTEETEDDWKTESLNRLPAILEDLQARGYEPADIAMLVRTNREEQDVIQKLLTYKNSEQARKDCSYDVMGNEGLLIGSAASVRFILGIMHLFVNRADSIQQTIVNYEYARGKMGLSEMDALNRCFAPDADASKVSPLFSDEENRHVEALQHSSLFNMVEEIISLFGVGDWHSEAVFIQAFQDVVYRYTTGKTADLHSFLTWWGKSGVKQCISTPDNRSAMRIMTVHKSKGLDFKVVVMPFCDWKIDSTMRNILWCEPDVAPFNLLPLLPVEYTTKLGQSVFARQYFDEQMHLFIDSLNVAYVAFTRAKHEMICLAPAPKKEVDALDKINTLSTLMNACFTVETPSLDAEIISLSEAYRPAELQFSLGAPTIAVGKTENQMPDADNRLSRYPSVKTNDRLRVRHQSLEFLLDNQELTDSKLNYGLIMHDILKNITHQSDQAPAIQSMLREGRISKDDSVIVEAEFEKFWRMDGVKKWFAADVQVLNETAILTPDGGQFRPDRVIIEGNNATVIDYKFGENEKPAYLKQVKNYMSLIAGMGYSPKGYVCYVTLGKVVEVD